MNKRQAGAAGEARAAEYLEERGYRILERNYRDRAGEIDIVAMDQGTLAFVEVKYRRSGACGSPFAAVDGRKQRRIIGAARRYMYEKGLGTETDCRFDVVAVTGDEIELLQNAFML